MPNNQKSQHGQAIIEMCIGLVAIMAVFLGMVFVAGLCISNVQTLALAKNNAENAARSLGGNEFSGAGESISYWDYGKDETAFTADDQAIRNGENDATTLNAGESFYQQLTNQSLSKSDDPNYLFNSSYYFNIPDATSDNNFSASFPSLSNFFVTAAGLVESYGADATAIHTLQENEYNTREQVRKLKSGFKSLFGINIDDIDLQKMNKVYMPTINEIQKN